MKFIKENIKLLIVFLIGMLISGGIVYAVTSASDVVYTREGTDIKSVADALNDLYANKKDIQVVKQGEQVASGTTVSVDVGSFIIVTSFGSMSASNTETIVEHLWGDTYAGIGSRTSVYKATGTNVTLTCDRTCSYIVIK